MKEIILTESFTRCDITKDMVDKCCKIVLNEARELGYQERYCYQIAAIQLWFTTLRYDERLEILKMLELKRE